jgi:superfamily II DNA or RNA helicase
VASRSDPSWATGDGKIGAAVVAQTERCLEVYGRDNKRVLSDANLEITTAEGGYGRKQVYELVQNGADALLRSPGRVQVLLTADCLYVANEGAALTVDGVLALMGSHLSQKRSDEIGRFGLGFKSVVAVCDRPQIFSRSGSLGFDREMAERMIVARVPSATRIPVLRLAEPLDAVAESSSDAHLAELMQWATTIVRLPLASASADSLRADLKSFPAEFVLFSPHVRALDLVDSAADRPRQVRLTEMGEGVLQLEDGSDKSSWRVVTATHRPSAKAAKDAGELANRENITLHWAVPLQNRSKIGHFWAFFPTESYTTLSGIINAPWKLSDDRRNLLEGPFNEELLKDVLPNLVAASFGSLADPSDPAGVLDLLPARGKEIRSWGDEVINGPVFERLARNPSLPDLQGAMRPPGEVQLHPRGLDFEILEAWRAVAAHAEAGRQWVDQRVDRTPERRLKAERLLSVVDRQATGVIDWLEALCVPPSLEGSAAAVGLVADLRSAGGELASEAMKARVLLLEDGRLAAPKAGLVFVRATEDETGYDFIDPRLAALPGVRRALARLDIEVLDRSGELRNALAGGGGNADWSRVWALCRQLPHGAAATILREVLPAPLERHLRVRTAEGKWVPMGTVFLGGAVVPLDGSRDQAFLIDPRYHQADSELLRALGAVSQPEARRHASDEPWLVSYREMVLDAFVAKAKGQKPTRERLLAEGPTPPWPLDPLSRLSSLGRLALTETALSLDAGERWTVRHETVASYGRHGFESPVTWWVKRHGMLRTGFGPWPVRQCLRGDRNYPEDVLPVADVTAATADRLQLLTEPSELTSTSWQQLLRLAASWPDARRYGLYSWAVHFIEPPNRVRVTLGGRPVDLPPADVAVTTDKEVFRGLEEQQTPAVLIDEDDDRDALMERWGLADGLKMLQQELLASPTGESQPLVDLYPPLKLYLDPAQFSLEVQLCSSLEMLTATPRGQVSKSVPGALVDGRVLVTAAEAVEQLRQVSHALRLDLTPANIRSILDQQEAAATKALIKQLRAARTTEERLALAVGDDALRRSLPATALESIEGGQGRPLEAVELAAMAVSVHGIGVLQHFRAVLDERGLNPPSQWAGRTAARRFVGELGFPSDFAGFSGDRRPAVFDVEGPAVLGPLHDYQEVVTNRIKSLLRGEGSARGLVSLPTGAGKTRVAVQALVEEVRDGRLDGPVVWIAQSDELCEQAVQTWAYVWRAVGPYRRMVISRFWSSNDATEEHEAFQLVVGTVDKLRNAVDQSAYEWLTHASVVVVDEAHSSIASSYTDVLKWLGRGRSRAERRPLVGLSATPFRNTNLVETERLVARYDGNRLDQEAFEKDPYEELQRRGILATVVHEILDGVDVGLTAEDQVEIERFQRLPSRVESRLGESRARNDRIVASVAGLPSDWPVLLFATSVENARALAALLTYAGVSAVSISADTEPAARRHYIEQFQTGELRVITNYGVLAQGFDAPAVRAVYVTRPTFSTNLYQQMIGRGLRGRLNGGSESVRIVNVRDNLAQYGDRLAFYDFEHLWSPRDDQDEAEDQDGVVTG